MHNETRHHLCADSPAQCIQFPTPVAETNAPQAALQPELAAGQAHLRDRLQAIAQNNPAGLASLLGQIYGDKTNPEQIQQLLQQARDGELPMPELRFVPAAELEGHHGAYANGVIYLSDQLRDQPGLMNLVLEAEYGHYLDDHLGGADTPGDEGQMLALGLSQGGGTLSPEALAAARELSDHRIMTIDGQQLEVETIPPAVIAGAWWAAQVTASTAVDTAIDFAIAAVLGLPMPGPGSTAMNALTNAIPGLGYWRTSRKLQHLSRAIHQTRQSLAEIGRMPGGQQIQARFNRAASDLEHALRQGDVGLARRKMDELLESIQDARTLQNGGRAASTVSRTDFYNNLARLSAPERVAQVRTRAREYARSEGWEPRPDLAARNNGREIFYDPQNRRYLAVDTQHGDFEILNRRGRHQGSMDLWGDRSHPRHQRVDSGRGHDINL